MRASSGQPLRLVAYSAIAVTLVGMTAERMYRLLLWVFYPGAVISLLWGAYYIATGGSQSASVDLSTGGSRPLAISTSLYCAGALFLALFTIRKAPGRAAALPHLAMAGIGLAGVILGFGRGVFAGVAVVLLVLLVVSPGVRRGVFFGLPLALPFLILISVIVLHTAPNLISSFQHRVSASPSQDANVIWRERANAAVLAQVREQPVFGVGFGRSSTFFLDVKSSNGFLVPFRQDIGQDPHNGFLLPARRRRDPRTRLVSRTARRLHVRCGAPLSAQPDRHGAAADLVGGSDVVRLSLRGGVGDDVRVSERPAPDLGVDRRAGGRADAHTVQPTPGGDALVNLESMRILAVSMSARPHGIGGMEDHLHTLTEELARRGHEVSVITGRHPDGLESETMDGVRWTYVDSAPHWLDPAWAPSSSAQCVRSLPSASST